MVLAALSNALLPVSNRWQRAAFENYHAEPNAAPIQSKFQQEQTDRG